MVIPKCVSKTQKNILSSLKKRLKQTYTHREQYKATSKDLEERLNACDIIRQEYNRLLELLNSGNVSKQNKNDEYKKKRNEQLEFTAGIKFIPTNTIEQNVEIIIEEYNKIQVTEQKKKYMKAKTKYYKLRNKLQKLKN